MGDEFESAISSAKNLKGLRAAASCDSFRAGVSESLKTPKDLINSVMVRLELKGKKFQLFESPTDEEIELFFTRSSLPLIRHSIPPLNQSKTLTLFKPFSLIAVYFESIL